ncbi:alpha/beta hydrolase family protein [Lacticaseibacillus mingshuiensis]|uniref:Alpha/beta hydrolase family protein n=1 Tax=Lacticaseibacillus mingshuiensis TaxID=2799574 RepID=A0ABW4CM92_9LACO|nr:alpha/beta fold hydrolase [Lacticaseibacillus mingshuiensis]
MTTEIAYGTDALQRADLYFPVQANGAALVFIHGGGWFRGDKGRDSELATALAAAGYLVAAVNYRLAPAALFPAAQNDLTNFLTWFKASDYEFDRQRIGLLGASVGGTMALTASLAAGYPVVTWSAILDLSNWIDQHQAVIAALAGDQELGLTDRHAIHDAFYKYFVQTYLGDLSQEKLIAVDPLFHLTNTLGPTLLFNGANELQPLSAALQFVDRAAAFDRDITLHVVPGTGHARDYTEFALPSTLRFFGEHLAK